MENKAVITSAIYQLATLMFIAFAVSGVATWVSTRGTVTRNVTGFVAALVASYSVGFVFDMWVQVYVGELPSANVVAPTFTWLFLTIVFSAAAFRTVTKSVVLAVPFLLNAMLALSAAAIRLRHIFVGVPLFLLGISFLIIHRKRNAWLKPEIANKVVLPSPLTSPSQGTVQFKKLIGKLLYGVVAAEGIVGLVLGFLVYFVRNIDSKTGLYFDGLGRQLEPAPLIVRFFMADSLWAGRWYFVLDMAVFWVAFGIGFALFTLASHLDPDGL